MEWESPALVISTSLEMTDQYILVCMYHEPPTPSTSELLTKKDTVEIRRLINFQGQFLNVAQVPLEMNEIKMEQVESRAVQMIDYGKQGGVRV